MEPTLATADIEFVARDFAHHFLLSLCYCGAIVLTLMIITITRNVLFVTNIVLITIIITISSLHSFQTPKPGLTLRAQVVENSLCIYFGVEWLFRFMAFKCRAGLQLRGFAIFLGIALVGKS